MKSKKPLPKGAAKTNSTKKPKTTVARKKPKPRAKKPAAKRPVGKPPLPYDSAIGDRICDKLADGYSLVQILKLPDMPGRTTVYRWLNESKEFTNNYVRAREEQADHFADECVEIADASVGLDAAGVTAMKLRVDTRKWRAGVLKPKVYGNKTTNEHTGVNGEELKVVVEHSVKENVLERIAKFD